MLRGGDPRLTTLVQPDQRNDPPTHPPTIRPCRVATFPQAFDERDAFLAQKVWGWLLACEAARVRQASDILWAEGQILRAEHLWDPWHSPRAPCRMQTIKLSSAAVEGRCAAAPLYVPNCEPASPAASSLAETICPSLLCPRSPAVHQAEVEKAAEQNEGIRADIHAALEAQTRAEADRHDAVAKAADAAAAAERAEEARCGWCPVAGWGSGGHLYASVTNKGWRREGKNVWGLGGGGQLS